MSLRAIRVTAMLVSMTMLAGCASTGRLDDQLSRLGFEGERAGRVDGSMTTGEALFRRIGAEPTNARLHFDNGLFLLDRGRRGDLEVARVAFSNAARLAPDWWQPQFALAATDYRLGRYDAALAAYSEAVDIRGDCGRLCYGYAFVAYRAGLFGLAATALQAARDAGVPANAAERTAADFLAAALAGGPDAHDAADLRARLRGDGTGGTTDAGNVSIDAYVIRQSRDASSTAGINLLSALQLQFGATLINADFTSEDDGPTVENTQQSFEVSIPTVNYALNVANSAHSTFSIEASPSVVAVVGKTSRFFEGANVLIVPNGDETEPLERDIGIDLKVTPNEIADDYIDLTAVLDLSNLSGSTLGGGDATVIQTDKTTAEASARIPFGRAIALGSGATMTLRDADNRVPGLGDVPALSTLFGTQQASARRNDVLVLLTARRGIAHDEGSRVDADALSQALFGHAPASVPAVSRLPSQAPRIDFMDWL